MNLQGAFERRGDHQQTSPGSFDDLKRHALLSQAPRIFSNLSETLAIRLMKTVAEVRADNLEALAAAMGTMEAVADAAGASAVYLSQLKTRALDQKTGKVRAMGSSLARRIESGCSKPNGWMDQQHPLEGDARPKGAQAHLVSHPAQSSSPLLNWGEIVTKPLPPTFRIAAPDDSMAPKVRAGQLVEFATGIAPLPGDGVLVADSMGALYFRVYRTRRADQWEAHPLNDAYRPLDSERDGLTVLAVLMGVLARWG